MIWIERGTSARVISDEELRADITALLARLGTRKRVLALPPDITRYHSRAGDITRMVYDYYGEALTDILPTLGTHAPMTAPERAKMFPGVPDELFRVHDWRKDPVKVGTVPEGFVREVTGGTVEFPVPLEVNRRLMLGGHDLILSIGQVVPHEVAGMANHNKNIFAGTGGAEGINKSHFIGAAYGIERIMGRTDTPVRRVLDYGSDHFIGHLPIVYILTVIGVDEEGRQVIRGLFAGDDGACFQAAAALSLKVNLTLLDGAPEKVVVYLEPELFRSTWLGNKAIYRTRMAIAKGGELLILAPGLKGFGEDPEIDRLIRKYGYAGREGILELVDREPELKENLGTAAHLIHGSSDGRFSISYAPGFLSRQEIEGVGYCCADLEESLRRYDPEKLTDGWNRTSEGERVFFVSNPALGLWAHSSRF